NRLSHIRLQHDGRSVNSHTPFCLAAVRRKLLRGQTVKLGSRPARLHEQPMDLCEGSNAPFDQLLEIIGRIGTRETHRRQHSGQDVLCSMLGLTREIDDLRVAAFALRDVLEAVDGTNNVSTAILDCLDVNERNAAQAARSLNVNFPFAHGNTGAQHIGHWALMVREQTAVWAEHSIRSAEPFVGIAGFRRPAPEFGGAAVVSKNETIPVTNINGKRQLFEQPPGQFEGLFLVTQTKGGTGCVRDQFDGSSHRCAPEGTRRVGGYTARWAIT